jgi:hypothetical protein
MKKEKMESKIRYAKRGCKCQICGTWLALGKRKANQFLCCNEDSDNLTVCQKRHRQLKLINDTAESNKDRISTLVCDQCHKTIPRINQHQKRCMSEVEGERSQCQKDAMKKISADHEANKNCRKRNCLKCNQPFESTGRFNKVCGKCDDINAKLSKQAYSVFL